MAPRSPFILCALALLMAALVSACGDSHGGRKEVSGAVQLEGEPLKDGSITFVPLDGQDTQGGGPITGGTYKVPRASGLKPGKYLVRISAGDGKTPADEEAGNPGGSTNIVSVDLVPAEWNVKSTRQIEVTEKGENRFDFTIPKKAAVKWKR
jgi:hypothetical protein